MLDREDVVRLVHESRRQQGLPDRITDPGALVRVAALVNAARGGRKLDAQTSSTRLGSNSRRLPDQEPPS